MTKLHDIDGILRYVRLMLIRHEIADTDWEADAKEGGRRAEESRDAMDQMERIAKHQASDDRRLCQHFAVALNKFDGLPDSPSPIDLSAVDAMLQNPDPETPNAGEGECPPPRKPSPPRPKSTRKTKTCPKKK